jgi:hypothetical protein
MVSVSVAVALFGAAALWSQAGPIPVANHSFESPSTPFVVPTVESWEATPEPEWYDDTGGFFWNQLAGVFTNLPAFNGAILENLDGGQAMYLFSVSEVGVFQTLKPTVDSDDSLGLFNLGRSYRLNVGVVPSTDRPPLEGATLQASLYYLNQETQRLTVAETTITNSALVFSNLTNLHEFEVRVPPVQADDPWEGKPIGVLFVSTVSTNLQGGVWDLDNVRVIEIAPPLLSEAQFNDGQFEFQLTSEPGLVVDVLRAEDLDSPLSSWQVVESFTNTAGMVPLRYPLSGGDSFFGARYGD